jgi:para-nitrobenzyl esterase
MDTQPNQNGAVVEISSGKIRGGIKDGIHFFKGIPYAKPTGGALRWRRAVAPDPWAGVRDTLAFGLRAPQIDRSRKPANEWIRDPGPKGEDCMVINVYTPGVNDAAKRPVMVYLHGGGFRYGSGAPSGIDGTNLAKNGDVVSVTLNHRLNVFGFANFGALGGDDFAEARNLGMLDLVDALKWVRENIAVFGGDPDNVLIHGQSGGGAKVAALMAMPEAKGLFHKAVMQSSSSHMRLATMENTERVTGYVVDILGAKDMAALQNMDADTVFEAYLAALKKNGGNDCFRPVVDGTVIPANPFDLGAADQAPGVPLMLGTAETEKSFYDIIVEPEKWPLTEDQLLRKTAAYVGIDEATATSLIAGYRQGRDDESNRDIYNRITSDHSYRRNEIEAAENRIRQSDAPVYLYEFTYRIPALGGALRSPHTMCLPFIFGTTKAAEQFTGTGPEQDRLTEAVQGAWVAFARSGNPNHDKMPEWQPYNVETRPTMTFDKEVALKLNPKPEDLALISACPPFITDQMQPIPA